jgi:hypothetical protein
MQTMQYGARIRVFVERPGQWQAVLRLPGMRGSKGGDEMNLAERLNKLSETHPEQIAKLMSAITADANNRQQLEQMNNAQVGDLLLEHVWADLDMWTWKAAIVEMAIDRLKGIESEPQS